MGTFFSSLDVSWGTLDHSPAGSVQKYPKSAENETFSSAPFSERNILMPKPRTSTGEKNLISTDVFSTYRDGRPIGTQEFLLLDTVTWEYVGVK